MRYIQRQKMCHIIANGLDQLLFCTSEATQFICNIDLEKSKFEWIDANHIFEHTKAGIYGIFYHSGALMPGTEKQDIATAIEKAKEDPIPDQALFDTYTCPVVMTVIGHAVDYEYSSPKRDMFGKFSGKSHIFKYFSAGLLTR